MSVFAILAAFFVASIVFALGFSIGAILGRTSAFEELSHASFRHLTDDERRALQEEWS